MRLTQALPLSSASALTPLVPLLLDVLTPAPGSAEFDETEFVPASDALQEVMAKSALSSGSGTKALTEPLLLWFDRYGNAIIENTLRGKDEQFAVCEGDKC